MEGWFGLEWEKLGPPNRSYSRPVRPDRRRAKLRCANRQALIQDRHLLPLATPRQLQWRCEYDLVLPSPEHVAHGERRFRNAVFEKPIRRKREKLLPLVRQSPMNSIPGPRFLIRLIPRNDCTSDRDRRRKSQLRFPPCRHGFPRSHLDFRSRRNETGVFEFHVQDPQPASPNRTFRRHPSPQPRHHAKW